MITSWEQRARREGIVVKQVSFPFRRLPRPPWWTRFRKAITPRTQVIEVTHITNLTGQILPVRDIVRLGRERDIEVFVDGAHAFAQFPFKRDDLECDYYATSLHKWLFAPIGTGLSLRAQEQAEEDLAAHGGAAGDGREHPQVRGDRHAPGREPQRHRRGDRVPPRRSAPTARPRACATCATAGPSRLAAADPRVKILTPLNDTESCGIALIHVDGLDTTKLQAYLWDKHRIMTTPIIHPEFNGLRITPSVYTTLDEVDTFSDRMEKTIKGGIPA